jgi:acyl-coenzyme A synthetase/AMP-(fatty) acid ligase
MFVIPKVMFSFPGKLIEYLNRNRINTIIWATSALRIVANLKALEKEKPKYLRKIMFSGEVMPNKVLNYGAAIYRMPLTSIYMGRPK